MCHALTTEVVLLRKLGENEVFNIAISLTANIPLLWRGQGVVPYQSQKSQFRQFKNNIVSRKTPLGVSYQ
jgi:hypothetical protein